MSLANPIYLWSLLGLAVPLAIHLLSRKEGKVIKLGSIRHVQETSTQQFKGIRLNEILLLALRCTLIAILCLAISGFYFDKKDGKWVVLEPGVERNKNVQAAIDSLESQGYESHWLSNTFPFASSTPDSTLSNYWFTLKQLGKQNLEEAIVFTYAKVEKFKGLKRPIPGNIKIIPVEPKETQFVLEAVQAADSVHIRKGSSSASITSFKNLTVKSLEDSTRVGAARSIKITLVSDKARDRETKILLAAVRAIDQITPHSIIISEGNSTYIEDSDPDWLFWMSDEKPPLTKANLLRFSPGVSNELLVQYSGTEWLLTQPLSQEVALDNHLTLSLAPLLTGDSSVEKIASDNDQRVLPESLAWISGVQSEVGAVKEPTFSLSLLGLFSVVFVFERFLSYRKNQ